MDTPPQRTRAREGGSNNRGLQRAERSLPPTLPLGPCYYYLEPTQRGADAPDGMSKLKECVQPAWQFVRAGWLTSE